MRREVVWVVDDDLGAYHAVEGVAAAIGMRAEHVADGLTSSIGSNIISRT